MRGFDFKEIMTKKWLLVLVIIFFTFVFLLAAIYLFFEVRYQNTIYPNVRLGDFDLGGYTVEQARINLQENDGLFADGINFKYEDKVLNLKPSIDSLLGLQVDPNVSIYEAFNYGRDGNPIINLTNRVKVLLLGKNILLSVNLDQEKIKQEIKKSLGSFEDEIQESRVLLSNNGFVIRPGKEGKEFDYDSAVKQLELNLKQIDDQDIKLELIVRKPSVFVTDEQAVIKQAEEISSLAPIKLFYDEFEKNIEKNLLVNWLELQNKDQSVIVTVSKEKIKKYLEDNIKKEIDQPAGDAEFERVGDRITTWKPASNGLDLDIEKTVEKIIIGINNREKEIELVVGEIRSLAQSSKDAEELGLIEVLGVGKSDFSGSPANRRHNIKVGADKLNGILIKPDEEFSLLKSLGNVDAEAGYLTELVIKDNKTVPEYGGGLCQIATTTFRSVLKSGLLVTMRRNHSYRVVYYEPAGTDATIYDPAPDFKFKNDTGKHVMLRTKMEGNNLTFTLWGTKDGRKVEMADPTIYNIVKPAETKIIETTELPVGEKKCIESAHSGADAYFDYKIIRPDGKEESTRYSSHYVPWRAVCLLGVAELSGTTDQSNKEVIGVGSDKWEKLKTE